MTLFIGLYRGESISTARLVAVSADSSIVSEFCSRLVEEDPRVTGESAVTETEERHKRNRAKGKG